MGPGNDLMQKSGDELWQVLQAPPYNVVIDASLKEVLRVMGFDNAQNMKQFGDKQFEEVEKFMRTTFHKVLKGRHKDNNEELEEAMEKYYGVFSCIPNDYEVMGGFRLSIQSCVRALNGMSQVKGSKQQTNLRSPGAETEAKIMKETKKPERCINTWLRDNIHIESETESITSEQNCTAVVEWEGNILTARVKCIACTKEISLRKTKSSWNTNNYFRHIENIHLLPKGMLHKAKGKQQLTIRSIFQATKNQSSGGDPADKTNTNEVTTPRSEAGEDVVDLGSDEDSNTTRAQVHSGTPKLKGSNTLQRAPAKKKTTVLEDPDEILVDRYSPDPMDYVEVDQGNSDDGGSSPVISRKNNSRKRTISETSDGDHFLENLETKTANL